MEKLLKLRDEMRADLLNGSILPFWQKYTVDEENGGFYGAVDVDLNIHKDAPKALVLNARLLWTFAGAYRIFGKEEYKSLADRAFEYLTTYFWDKENGGGYWMLNADGSVKDDTKMTYAQGFMLYAFSEYVRATGSEAARKYADMVYDYLENECKAGKYYLENARGTGTGNGAITKAGTLSMNTHIHILEPMTCYFRIRHDKCVEESELEEIRQELVRTGYLKKTTSRKQQRQLPQSKPYRYLSDDGIGILVGKNAAQNDRITLNAKPDETWLHAKDMPGSHVIICCEGEIPRATMKQAALLAAWYSKGQRSSMVPVDYTLRRYVKKPSGAAPGKVVYTHHKTAYMTPEESEIKGIRLLEA